MTQSKREWPWNGPTRTEAPAAVRLARRLHTSSPRMLTPNTAWSHRSSSRGFTLTELMAVIVIVGILAALALVGYRKYIDSARSSEAVWMVNSIRGAQEAYRAETLSYLDVCSDLSDYYPAGDPGDFKVQWGGGAGPTAQNFRILNVTADGGVYYRYAVIAGPPGPVALDGLQYNAVPINTPTAIEPWYFVQAWGNVDNDDTPSYYIASSFSNDVFWQNEGE